MSKKVNSFNRLKKELKSKAGESSEAIECFLDECFEEVEPKVFQRLINWGKEQGTIGVTFLGNSGAKFSAAGRKNVKEVKWEVWQKKLDSFLGSRIK